MSESGPKLMIVMFVKPQACKLTLHRICENENAKNQRMLSLTSNPIHKQSTIDS